MGQQENKHLYTLNREAVYMLAAAAQRSDYQLLDRLGVDEACASLLQMVGIQELDRLQDLPTSVVDLRFNASALRRSLAYLQRETAQERLIDRGIQLGLRQPMLRQLTGMSRREYDQRRQALRLPAKEPGRVESLSERDEIAVLELWERLASDDQISLLERLCIVSERTRLSADRVWNAVMEGV